jgi:4-amino-4-deoxy-L-arabinose transferase-like glycosyltransferase
VNLEPRMTTKPEEKRRIWQSLWAITIVALVLRLVAIAFLYRNTWNDYQNHLLFGFEIGRIARSLASGQGYANPMNVETGPTAWMTPVYTLLLAGVFKAFGIYSKMSALVILAFNSVFSALTCVPVYFAARRNFGTAVATIAAWIWALSPYAIYIAGGFVWETCLSALLLAILFLWTLKLQERPTEWTCLGYGGLWGLAGLTNASVLSVVPFLAAWTLYPTWPDRQKWIRFAALIALGVFIVLLPWQVRSYATFHRFIPLRDNFWLEVAIGNDGRTEGWVDNTAHPSINRAQQAEFARVGELPYMREKRGEALGYIRGHVGQFIVMCARRFGYMWTGFWNLDPRNVEIEFYSPANFYLPVSLTLAMLVGLWAASRESHEPMAAYLFVFAVYPLVFCVTHPEIRYRHVMEPEIVVIAAVGIRFLALSARQTIRESLFNSAITRQNTSPQTSRGRDV